MKICPKCKTEYGDEMNFCLTDGSTLKDAAIFGPEDTISLTDNATLEYKKPQTAEQNKYTNLTDFGKPRKSSLKLVVLVGIFGLILLFFGVIGGAYVYFRNYVVNGIEDFPRTPTRTPLQGFTPSRTPETKAVLKLEILEKVKSLGGENYLKCKLTNTGESIARPYSVTLAFSKDDVVIKENSALVRLKYLKPQQSVPVWVGLYGTENYTSVKLKEPVSSFPIYKSTQNLFLDLNFTETEMKLAYSTSYKVEGIVENQNYETISPELYIIFYDEKGEIVGIEKKYVSNLGKNVKTKFDATISNRDLFGKPKTFEIIPVAD